jgi:predicted ArsR family transcriptional regulator
MLLSVLAEPRRRAILDTFATRPAADLTVDDIAAEQHLHRSVAFTHLERLADAALLVRGSRPGRRGRPARTYRYAACAVEASQPPRQHRLLAQILGTALDAEGARGAAAAHAQGRRHGLALAGSPESAAGAIERLAPIGGDYELRGSVVVARNCVFREACESAREVVCSAHAGIIEGALGAAGATSRVIPAGPDESGGCRYRLESRLPARLPATAGSRLQ